MQDRSEIDRWRQAERERLIAARLALPRPERERLAARVAETLDREIQVPAAAVVSFYWPFRGELDLRPWLRSLVARGARAALPVVVARGRPLVFREWVPGRTMARGIWNIPVPAEDAAVLRPDIAVAPLVGFDAGRYRLGYGGGYYDRTLAALPLRPLVVGVGLELARLETIWPQPHDIPMDLIVTEEGVAARRPGGAG